MFFIILFLTILAVAVVVRLMGIMELTAELRGETTEEEVTPGDNQFNGFLFIPFLLFLFGFTIYEVMAYKDLMLTPPGSEHGHEIDNLMYFTFAVIGIVFFITQALLFYFAFRYHSKPGAKAFYYPHNNKLEMLWTAIPAVVLTAMISWGLYVWDNVIDDAPEEDHIVVELFAKQFKWVARYPGEDGQLGRANYKFIRGANELGLDSADASAKDDILESELHLPVGKTVEFRMRSQDILHGAFMPYFRVQMNVVPGMTTTMHFKPTVTTSEMKKIMKDEEFEYILLCNKICGVSHYNMQMNIIVESEEEYNHWLASKERKRFMAVAKTQETKANAVTDSLKQTAIAEVTAGEKKH